MRNRRQPMLTGSSLRPDRGPGSGGGAIAVPPCLPAPSRPRNPELVLPAAGVACRAPKGQEGDSTPDWPRNRESPLVPLHAACGVPYFCGIWQHPA